MLAEDLAADGGVLLAVAPTGQIGRHLDQIGKAHSVMGQRRGQVGPGLTTLRGEPDGCGAVGRHRDLPGRHDEARRRRDLARVP